MNGSATFNGARLRAERHRNGWTQAELARRAGVRERQIIRWENGQNEPRFDAVVALAEALGVDVQDLCGPASDDEEESMQAVAPDLLRALYLQIGVALGERAA